MLDHELQLALLVVWDCGAVAPHPGLGDDLALGRVDGASDVRRVDDAVGARCGVPEELVALHPDDLVDALPERLLPGPVHPDHGVGGVVQDDDVVDGVQYHVHDGLSVDLRLFHFYP